MNRRQLLTVHGPLLLVAMFWGTNFVALKRILETLTVADTVVVRSILAALCNVVMLVILRRSNVPVLRRDLPRILFVAILGGVLTPTGVGTTVEDGKQKIEIDGKAFLLETALRSQFALVHAFLADYLGNLSYALTARNFNPVMAMAADTVIVTAEHIVPVGVIAPDHVMTPAPLVDYLITNG